jgi:hypothetical protein
MASIYTDLVGGARQANLANEARYKQGLGIMDQLISLFQPGGQFGKGFEAQLGRAKTKSVAQGMQSLVSSGLVNTTQAAGLGKKFEEEVGTPARLRLEDLRIGRLADALSQKSGFIERREDVGPSLPQLMEAGRGLGRTSRPSYTLPRTVGAFGQTRVGQ